MRSVNGKLRPSNWKYLSLSLVLAAVVGLLAWPAWVQAAARRAAPEQAIGGITFEEHWAQQAQLNARLVGEMPAGAMETPVRIELSKRDRDDIAAPAVSGVPLLIGVVKTIPSDVGVVRGDFKGGTFEKTPDGGFVWAATVTSPGAQAIRVHFKGFSLPPGAEAYFYGLNGQAHGPYTGKGRNGNGEFWTRSIQADTGVIQLRVKGGVDQQQISFMVLDLGHIQGRSVTAVDTIESTDDTWPCADNVPCLIDAMCLETLDPNSPALPAKDAVAKMEWIHTPYIYTCTGGLLVDTDPGTQIPYFLTANHCFDASISNLETFFRYTTDSCEGTCPGNLVHGGTPPPSSTLGITVVATGTIGDFTLATLDEDPPAGVTFLGWNNTPIAFTDGALLYRISNANFGPQVYADYEVDTGSPVCSGIPRGAWIYSTNIQGSTMGGSSGSPVLNSDSEVVGQLTGCCGYNCDECDFTNNWTIDGALAGYWDAVATFLDPGVCNNNGICDEGEDCSNCPNDCISGGGAPGCGNGTCEPGEDCNTCPADCRAKTGGKPDTRYCCYGNLPDCGNPKCSEDGWSCGSSVSFCCGDTVCESAEDITNCAIDCDLCGNGTCDPGEDSCNCPSDCGTPPSTETSCTDGVDNDCDGSTDCDDANCASDSACSCVPTEDPEASCNDGIDNDCDGLIDCDDVVDCADDQACSCIPKGGLCLNNDECCSQQCLPAGRCK